MFLSINSLNSIEETESLISTGKLFYILESLYIKELLLQSVALHLGFQREYSYAQDIYLAFCH